MAKAPLPDTRRVCLGRIAGAHGVRGEVRLVAYTREPEAIAAYGALADEADERRFKIVDRRAVEGGLIVKFEGVETREAAAALKGTDLYVARAALPPPGEEEWYYADLVGLVAMSAAGAALGQVVAVQNFGAGDLLELRPATGGATVLVPFTAEIVPEIDVEGGWLLLLPPEGLFE